MCYQSLKLCEKDWFPSLVSVIYMLKEDTIFSWQFATEKQLPASIADVHHASHVRTVSLLVCGKSDTSHNQFYHHWCKQQSDLLSLTVSIKDRRVFVSECWMFVYLEDFLFIFVFRFLTDSPTHHVKTVSRCSLKLNVKDFLLDSMNWYVHSTIRKADECNSWQHLQPEWNMKVSLFYLRLKKQA